MDFENNTPGIPELIQVLRAINATLSRLGRDEELLDYPEAARRLGISGRKLSDLVRQGRLTEGWHFLRIDTNVRFPPDIARRFMRAAPSAPKGRMRPPRASSGSPEVSRPAVQSQRPGAGRPRSFGKSTFNLDY